MKNPLIIKRLSLPHLLVIVGILYGDVWLCIHLLVWFGWVGLTVGVLLSIFLVPAIVYAVLLTIAVFATKWTRSRDA